MKKQEFIDRAVIALISRVDYQLDQSYNIWATAEKIWDARPKEDLSAFKKRFIPPSVKEVDEYIIEKNYRFVTGLRFVDFYQSKNWMVGSNKMKDWQAAVRGWESREEKRQENKNNTCSIGFL